MSRPLLIIGTDSLAMNCYSWARSYLYIPFAFLRESNSSYFPDTLFEKNVLKDFSKISKNAHFLVAVNDPFMRSKMFADAESNGMHACAPVIHQKAVVDTKAHISSCSIISPMAVICARAKIGKGVYVGPNAYIGTDSEIGDFANIAPNSVIGDRCKIESCASVGANSVVSSGIILKRFASVAPCSHLTSNIEENGFAVGNPAEVMT